MGKMLRAVTPTLKKDGGTLWTQIGVAWINTKNGKNNVKIVLNALPLPHPDEDGRAVVMLFEDDERDRKSPRLHDGPLPDRAGSDEYDDEVPF